MLLSRGAIRHEAPSSISRAGLCESQLHASQAVSSFARRGDGDRDVAGTRRVQQRAPPCIDRILMRSPLRGVCSRSDT